MGLNLKATPAGILFAMAKKTKTERFKSGEISAVDALHEAQKIAFAPVVLQVARSLLELGILREVERSG